MSLHKGVFMGCLAVLLAVPALAHKPSAVEMVPTREEADGVWRIAGYVIR